MKDRAIDILLTMPKESCGRCIAVARSGKRCNHKGILANGLCIECWDKSVGYKDDLISNIHRN